MHTIAVRTSTICRQLRNWGLGLPHPASGEAKRGERRAEKAGLDSQATGGGHLRYLLVCKCTRGRPESERRQQKEDPSFASRALQARNAGPPKPVLAILPPLTVLTATLQPPASFARR